MCISNIQDVLGPQLGTVHMMISTISCAKRFGGDGVRPASARYITALIVVCRLSKLRFANKWALYVLVRCL